LFCHLLYRIIIVRYDVLHVIAVLCVYAASYQPCEDSLFAIITCECLVSQFQKPSAAAFIVCAFAATVTTEYPESDLFTG